MNERLLQYIWQFQHYNITDLRTTNGEPLSIIHHGILNQNQGPDFLDGKINYLGTTWVGNIELHILSSDWNLHHHSIDPNYNNIILHVVWQHDCEIEDPGGNTLITLELQGRVSKILLDRYNMLMNNAAFIPCRNNLQYIKPVTWCNWKDRLMIERLEQRSSVIFEYLKNNNNNWEETFWCLIARNFGVKVNAESFEKIAQSIPLKILARHKSQVIQLEAILFGQSGLLNREFSDDYPKMLKAEYLFYKTKYGLKPPSIHLHFLRMRPGNFPGIRLAQLAVLIHNSLHLFSQLREKETVNEMRKLLNVTANDYWHYHYTFDTVTDYKPKHLGKQMVEGILINTIIPVLFAYGHFHKEQTYKEKALQWLEQIPAEENAVTKSFDAMRLHQENAFDSQAVLQLHKNYCTQWRCLECAIGDAILKE